MKKIRLGDACDILNGFAFKSENYVDSGIRVIRIANVQKGYIEDNTPVFYPLETNELDKYMLEEGDLLMALTGNVGRVAILKKEFMPAALNQRVACLRLKTDRVAKDYLFHVLNSAFFEQQCIQSSKGVAQKNMSTEWLKDYEIPMYPKEQQELIADNLNIKEFTEMSEEWLDFIVDCRSGKDHNYDIVIGAMADDQIYNFVSDYIDGTITREQFWVLAKFKYPTHQIAFCTKDALKCLEYRDCEVL